MMGDGLYKIGTTSTSVKESIDVTGLICSSEEVIKSPEINVTLIIPTKRFIAIILPGNCRYL
jgi:hypothetical protein